MGVGERYSFTYSQPQYEMEVIGQQHTLATLLTQKNPDTHWIAG
jgi:hypothetical protein